MRTIVGVGGCSRRFCIHHSDIDVRMRVLWKHPSHGWTQWPVQCLRAKTLSAQSNQRVTLSNVSGRQALWHLMHGIEGKTWPKARCQGKKNKEPRIWMILTSLTAFQSKVLWFGGSIVNAVGCQFMFEGDFCTASGEICLIPPFFSSAFSHAKVLLWPVSCWISGSGMSCCKLVVKKRWSVTKMTFLLCSCARQLQSPSVSRL